MNKDNTNNSRKTYAVSSKPVNTFEALLERKIRTADTSTAARSVSTDEGAGATISDESTDISNVPTANANRDEEHQISNDIHEFPRESRDLSDRHPPQVQIEQQFDNAQTPQADIRTMTVINQDGMQLDESGAIPAFLHDRHTLSESLNPTKKWNINKEMILSSLFSRRHFA